MLNLFRVTYTDGSDYITQANGTLKEFTDYLMQFGGLVVDEDPNTGKETRRYIARVEQVNPDLTTAYGTLKSRYGGSAATTYDCLRENGLPAWLSYQRMKAQIKELGTNYPGGLECTKYRRSAITLQDLDPAE